MGTLQIQRRFQVDRDGVGTAYTFGDTGVRIFLQGLSPIWRVLMWIVLIVR